jgi:hypothetical protein
MTGAAGSRAAVLRYRGFPRFFVGYAASLLGSSMSAVAVTFGVLGSGGSADDRHDPGHARVRGTVAAPGPALPAPATDVPQDSETGRPVTTSQDS